MKTPHGEAAVVSSLRGERCDCPCGCAIPADDGPSCHFCLLGTHREPGAFRRRARTRPSA